MTDCDCPIAVTCGGCALIGLPYETQLQRKYEAVVEALGNDGPQELPPIDRCLPAPAREHYRNRAKLAVAGRGGAIRIGLYRRGTNEIVDLAPCRVQSRALLDGLGLLREWLARYRLARPVGPVFYVDLRETADSGCHLTLVVDSDVGPPEEALDRLTRDWPGLIGIAVNRGSPDSSYPMGQATRTARGAAAFDIDIPGPAGDALRFELPATGFFQVAPAALGPIHAAMGAHLDGPGPLYDLYCGVGVHGIAIARRRSRPSDETRLIGVENSAEMTAAATRNAARHSVPAMYIAGPVEERIAALFAETPPCGIILNPGRSGCRAQALTTICESGAPRIAYLSCNAQTLARDLTRLTDAGLDVTRIQPIDLVPQTDHVEVLALLTRGR